MLLLLWRHNIFRLLTFSSPTAYKCCASAIITNVNRVWARVFFFARYFHLSLEMYMEMPTVSRIFRMKYDGSRKKRTYNTNKSNANKFSNYEKQHFWQNVDGSIDTFYFHCRSACAPFVFTNRDTHKKRHCCFYVATFWNRKKFECLQNNKKWGNWFFSRWSWDDMRDRVMANWWYKNTNFDYYCLHVGLFVLRRPSCCIA